MNRYIMTSILLLMTVVANAQNGAVDFLGSMGKMYSVVAIIAIIFIGILLFLWRIEKKVDKIENHINNGK